MGLQPAFWTPRESSQALGVSSQPLEVLWIETWTGGCAHRLPVDSTGHCPCQTMTNYNVGQCIASGLLVRFRPDAIWCCTMIHNLFKQVLGHSLFCSLIHSHRSLICLLCAACFTRANSLRSLVNLPAYSLPSSWSSGIFTADHLLPLGNWLKTNRMF